MSQATLEIQSPAGSKRLDLGDTPLSIGRQAGNAVVLDETMASRQHCVIEKADEGWRVRDLDSRNGTRVNGKPVKATLLSNGDVIQIGKTTLTLSLPEAPPAAPAAEMLTLDDIVETTHDASSMPFPERLAMVANNLPDKSVSEKDIALLNGRGQIVHDAGGTGMNEMVRTLKQVLAICFRSHATDIHVEPQRDGFYIRIRIDGTMVDIAMLPQPIGHKLTTMVKVLSDIDIQHRNAIQEGHFAANAPTAAGKMRRVDYRVSLAPAVFGQKLVVRILDTANAPSTIADLALPQWMRAELADAIRQDSGMVLVCGPTGSGKTTSLYSLLRSIDTRRRNVVTIEDPVEVQLESVTQIPVDDAGGKSFAALLRSVLRQDPDVILVGEIRDAETARTAMQAAVTGHLVFSTVHTKDSIGTVFRLIDLGVEPYMVSQGLHMVLAQRLVRKLCDFCKKPVAITPAQKQQLTEAGADADTLYEPRGCAKCLGTGFLGRQAFFELLKVNEAMRDLIPSTPTSQQLVATMEGTPFERLRQTGYKLVAAGVTSLGEIDHAAARL